MSVSVSTTNKPLNPRAQDLSPKGYNRAALYSGKALDFDGVNDLITITDNAAVDFGTSDFSIAFTMNSSVAGYGRVLDKRNGTNGYTLSIGTSKELVLELNDGTGSSGFSTSSIYADGKLKHVVVSADRDGNASFYVNGVFDEAIDISSKSGNLDSTSDLFIGADAPSGTSIFYNGQLSGLKMYSTALTAAQVADLYLNPEKIVPDGVASSALKLWLPMIEGAGTTAYDGSGNGNHGTINGATWVSGVGAPVAQTALVSWNKGTNLVQYSENFEAAGWALASANGGTNPIRTFNYAEAPDGTQTATRIQMDRGTNGAGYSQVYQYPVNVTSGQLHVYSVWAKSLSGTPTISVIGDAGRPAVTLTNEWVRYSGTYTPAGATQGEIAILGSTYSSGNSQTADILVWGYQIEQASTAGPYIPTLATAQTSPVLLPQGLTANKDITGVNAFESARNPYALNLDGASWGEVHDNASLDFGSGMTIEAWIKMEDVSQAILGKWNFSANKKEYLLYYNAGSNLLQTFFGNGSNVQFTSTSYTADGSWVHFVGTADGSTITPYLNGVAGTTTAQTTPLGASDIPVRIGVDDAGNSFAPNQIALPRIYNRALTATEVARNYNADRSKFGL